MDVFIAHWQEISCQCRCQFIKGIKVKFHLVWQTLSSEPTSVRAASGLFRSECNRILTSINANNCVRWFLGETATVEKRSHFLLVWLIIFVFQQGGVSDDVSLTAYITAALLELDSNVTVRPMSTFSSNCYLSLWNKSWNWLKRTCKCSDLWKFWNFLQEMNDKHWHSVFWRSLLEVYLLQLPSSYEQNKLCVQRYLFRCPLHSPKWLFFVLKQCYC